MRVRVIDARPRDAASARPGALTPGPSFYWPSGRMGRGILSMTLVEIQQLRMLERLRSAGEQPVTLDQLRASRIDFPAVVIGELELNGYAIERVYEHGRQIGVRLAGERYPRSARLTPAPAMAPSFAIGCMQPPTAPAAARVKLAAVGSRRGAGATPSSGSGAEGLETKQMSAYAHYARER
jgi:hypothetical protein